jgi:hypothetical protein
MPVIAAFGPHADEAGGQHKPKLGALLLHHEILTTESDRTGYATADEQADIEWLSDEHDAGYA